MVRPRKPALSLAVAAAGEAHARRKRIRRRRRRRLECSAWYRVGANCNFVPPSPRTDPKVVPPQGAHAVDAVGCASTTPRSQPRNTPPARRPAAPLVCAADPSHEVTGMHRVGSR